MPKIKIGSKVKVTWEDHWEITNRSYTLEQIKERCAKPYTGEAIGYVVLNNRKILALATNYWPEDEHYDGSFFMIIKKNIVDLEVLDGRP